MSSHRRAERDEEESEEGSEYESGSGSEEGTEYETGSEYEDEEEDEAEEEPIRTARHRQEDNDSTEDRRRRDQDDSYYRNDPVSRDKPPAQKENSGFTSAGYSSRVSSRESAPVGGEKRNTAGEAHSSRAMPSGSSDKADMVRESDPASSSKSVGPSSVGASSVDGRRKVAVDTSQNHTGSLVGSIDVRSYCNVIHIIDREYVLCGCGDSTVRLYSLSSGKIVRFFEGLADRVLSCSSFTRTLPQLSISNYDYIRNNKIKNWADQIDLHKEEYLIVAGSRDETICSWALTGELEFQIVAHEGAVWSLACTAFYESIESVRGRADVPVIRCIISAGSDGLVKVWSLDSGDHLKTYRLHGGRVNSLAVVTDVDSPFEFRVVSGGMDKKLHVWDLLTATTSFVLTGHIDEVMSVAVVRTPNNGHYDAIHKLSSKLKQTGKFLTEIPKGSHDVENLVLVSGSRDRTIWVWDYRNRKAIYVFRGHSGPVTVVSGFVSRSRQLIIVSGSDDATLRLWNLRMGVCVDCRRSHKRSVRGLSVLHLKQDGSRIESPIMCNSSILVSGGWDKLLVPHDETDNEHLVARNPCCIM